MTVVSEVAVIRIRVLGPLEVDVDGTPADLGGPRQRSVLARLIAEHGQVVSAGRLIEDLYADEAPPQALAAVQSYVSHLRRALEPARAARAPSGVLVTAARGYQVRLPAEAVDAWSFEDEVHKATALDDPATAHDRLSAVLTSWRGAPFGEFSGLAWADLEASRLDELRLAATLARAEAALRLGWATRTVGDLDRLTAEHPLREEAWRLLALALYQSGRQGDALAALRRARTRLADDLGIDPGPALRELEDGIFAQDPRLSAPSPASHQTAPDATRVYRQARRTVPGLLPADVADFTGRAEQVAQINRHLTAKAGPNAGLALPVVVVTGQGGVGKTSLAVHAAHGQARQFEDGQLFADLHGASAQPAGPAQILERFLRALGLPGPQIPEGLDERAEAYRNLLAGRRVLVVLDDAASESQVLPLLPGSGSAAVLVTSRGALAGLAGATRISLGVFEAGQSVALLGRIAGRSRVGAQREAAARVTEQCGHLPLALRIAGGRLAVRPHWDVRQLAERLADQARRLDELEIGELGVRASISLSYDAASEAARRLLRRLTLLEVPVFSGWVSGPLLDQPPAEADDVLDELVGARLIEPVGTAPGADCQYRFHDLIRLFARERLAAEEPVAEQRAALERALGGLLFLGEQARHRRRGGGYLRLDPSAARWPLPGPLTEVLAGDPMVWLERERAALVAGVRQAADAGLVELCWSLATIADTFFSTRSYLDDWQHTAEVALAATRQAGHVRGQAAALHSLGSLYEVRGQLVAARQALEAATLLFQGAGDDHGSGMAIRLTALIDLVAGRLEAATCGFEQALAIFRTTEDQEAVAYVLRNLARVKLELGDPGLARELLSEALPLTKGQIEAQVLYSMGEAQLQTGELADAAGTFAQALARVRAVGDQVGESYVLRGLGLAALRQGQLDSARAALQHALELADATGVPVASARALLGLSELALASGEAKQAVTHARQAAEKLRDLGVALEQARALTLLSTACTAAGDVAAAQSASAQANAIRLQAAVGAQGAAEC
jgi:DNA-binding SARP family transcriptional activator/Tfp pilus assembly protein PilF